MPAVGGRIAGCALSTGKVHVRYGLGVCGGSSPGQVGARLLWGFLGFVCRTSGGRCRNLGPGLALS